MFSFIFCQALKDTKMGLACKDRKDYFYEIPPNKLLYILDYLLKSLRKVFTYKMLFINSVCLY